MPTTVEMGTQTEIQNPVPEIEPTPSTSKRGRPKKSLDDCKPSTKRAKLDDVLVYLDDIAKGMKTDLNKLLFLLPKRQAYKDGDFEQGKFFSDLLEFGIESDPTKITPEHALYLK